MAKIIWSEIAKNKIFEIADFIALDSPSIADKWVHLILSKETLIKENPKIGRVVPEFSNPMIRELIVGEYRLIYSIEEKYFIVLTVINCKEQSYFEDTDKLRKTKKSKL